VHYTRLMAQPMDRRDRIDAAHWDAVEEATELLQEGRYVEALVELRQVLKADPKNPYAFHYLGVAFFETAEREAARDAYEAALRIAPDYLGARVALSNVLRMLGDAPGALRQAREALRRRPEDAEAAHAAGLAYAAVGNRPAARQHLQNFLDSKPEFEAASEVRGILEMLGLGDDDEPVRFDN
jgi:tetratricopeptide (TPR) repeat protein